MKKLYLFTAATFLCIGYAAFSILTPEDNKSFTHTTANPELLKADSSGDFPLPEEANYNWLAYDFTVETKMLNDSGHGLSGSSFRGKILLMRSADSNLWLGKVTQSFTQDLSNSKTKADKIHLAANIPFTSKYNHHVFSEVDFLGLSASHPINAIKHLLAQLSYQLNAPLKIDSATTTTHYTYQKDSRQVTRTEQSRIIKDTNSGFSVAKYEDDWLLQIDNRQLPYAMKNDIATIYQSPNGQLTVNQQLEITASEVNHQQKPFDIANFSSKQNINLAYTKQSQNSTHSINNEQELLQALTKLSSLPDDALAKAIGRYLVENYSVEEIALLLEQQHEIANLASLIIYSIQKHATFASEVVLVDLLSHPQLAMENKQRIAMSLGRFEALSELGLQHLVSTTEDADNRLANVARLSIGTAARYNPEQESAVTDYLSNALASGKNTALTLLAINNSGSQVFNEEAAGMLGKKSGQVDVALIKLLSGAPEYHDKVIEFATHSKSAKSINELARAISANKLTLSAQQQSAISARIAQTDNELIKDQLSKLLTANEKRW